MLQDAAPLASVPRSNLCEDIPGQLQYVTLSPDFFFFFMCINCTDAHADVQADIDKLMLKATS